ncbi:hypothetical protein PTTG_31115, partial [Puccinia triticina 1-1 BBBD Race 1]
INPLFARIRYPVICRYLMNRLIITGVGRVTDVIELMDKDDTVVAQHELVVNVGS